MVTIAFVTEGLTDQIILEHIIYKFAKDHDPLFTQLQPKLDPENQDIQLTPGNWDQVIKYISSDSFKKALVSNPELYIIVQIDSDVFERSVDISEDLRFDFNNDEGERLSTADIYEAISEKLIENIDSSTYEEHKNRIIFAVTVNESECWMLPWYYTNSKAGKETGCIKTLNRELSRMYKFSIDKKDPEYYRIACKPIIKLT